MKVVYGIVGKSILGLLPVTMIAFVLLIDPLGSKPGSSTGSTTISEAVLSDSLPNEAVNALNAKLISGYHLQSGRMNAYLYKYEADHDRVLTTVAKLPVLLTDAQADFQCLQLNDKDMREWNQLQEDFPSEQVAFAFPEESDHYVGFQCLKPPFAHRLLLSTKSKEVIHLVVQTM